MPRSTQNSASSTDNQGLKQRGRHVFPLPICNQISHIGARPVNGSSKQCKTHHAQIFAERINLFQCFYCATESELDSLCQLLHENLVVNEKQPLFVICSERPAEVLLKTLDDPTKSPSTLSGTIVNYCGDFNFLITLFTGFEDDSDDDEFEMLG